MCDDGARRKEEQVFRTFLFSSAAVAVDEVDNREVSREQRELEDTAQVRRKHVQIVQC